MSPSTPPPTSSAQLRQLIHYNLDNHLLQNALFLSGRLHGLDPRSPETAHLVALSHLKLGHFRAAYDYSKDPRLLRSSSSAQKDLGEAHLNVAYVFAQACLALGRYNEGISALERCSGAWRGRNDLLHADTHRRRAPDAPAVCNLLGRLCRANGEDKKSADWFAESLKGNPFMWDAFVELSDAGVPIRTQNIFKLHDNLRRDLFAAPLPPTQADPQARPPIQAPSNKPTNDPYTPAGGYDPFNPTRSAIDPGLNHGGRDLMSRLNGNTAPGYSLIQPSDWDTPSGIHFDDDVTMDETHVESEAPPAPLRKKTGLHGFVGDIEVPKLRGIGITARGKVAGRSDFSEPDGRPTTSGIPISHKRTVSGQPLPPAPPSSTAGSDGGSQGIRRSTRIQNHATASTASTTAKSSASSRLAGVFSKNAERDRERRELPKVKATGTKGSGRVGTVGRNVSGNSKRFPPSQSDIDAKESHRPASQASTIRELREPLKRAAISAPAVQQPQQTAVVVEQPQLSRRDEEDSLKWLLDLFAKLGEGYFNLSRYNAPQALATFKSLPIASRETPWVLSKIGRALYENAKYNEAADVFQRVRKLTPTGIGGMAESAWLEDTHIYSTVLWHLKKDIELAYLAHTLLDLDRLSPEPWIALGNSFSLAREHDKAIKCFKRATQLASPNTASAGSEYAWTLMGHEHILLEEFDKATLAYQQAISANPRHYAGWYGLGSVFEKMGGYAKAEMHYKVAWNINPRNAVLAVCLGMVSEKLGRDSNNSGGQNNWVLDARGENKAKEALSWYERAVHMDPKSAKARFMKARTLLRLAQMSRAARDVHARVEGGGSRHEILVRAKQELETLREMAPQESMVHFLLGRTLKICGDRAGAIREMTIALELDPKASPAIKEALESLEMDDEGSFDEDDED